MSEASYMAEIEPDWEEEESLSRCSECCSQLDRYYETDMCSSCQKRKFGGLTREEAYEARVSQEYRDLLLGQIKDHGCASTSEGVLLITETCKRCDVAALAEIYARKMRDIEKMIEESAKKRYQNNLKRGKKSKERAQTNRWRCLVVGCNPKLIGESAAAEHKSQTGHRVAKYPVRSEEGRKKAAARSASGYYDKYNVGYKAAEFRPL